LEIENFLGYQHKSPLSLRLALNNGAYLEQEGKEGKDESDFKEQKTYAVPSATDPKTNSYSPKICPP
jgi:hypothetical protein